MRPPPGVDSPPAADVRVSDFPTGGDESWLSLMQRLTIPVFPLSYLLRPVHYPVLHCRVLFSPSICPVLPFHDLFLVARCHVLCLVVPHLLIYPAPFPTPFPSPFPFLPQEAVWFLSNITASNRAQAGWRWTTASYRQWSTTPPEPSSSTEGMCLVSDCLTISGSPELIQHLIEATGVEPMCHLLHCKDTQVRRYSEQIQHLREAGGVESMCHLLHCKDRKKTRA